MSEYEYQEQVFRALIDYSKIYDTIENIKEVKPALANVLDNISDKISIILVHNEAVAETITGFDLRKEIEPYKPELIKNESKDNQAEALGALYEIISNMLSDLKKFGKKAGACKKPYTDQLFGKNKLENVIEEINKLTKDTEERYIKRKILEPLETFEKKIAKAGPDVTKLNGFSNLVQCVQNTFEESSKFDEEDSEKDFSEKIKDLKGMKFKENK